jgi:hypothetical protein
MFKLIFFIVLANPNIDESMVLRVEPTTFSAHYACQEQGTVQLPVEQARPEAKGRRVRFLCVQESVFK